MLSSEADAPAEVIFTFDPDAAGQKAAMRAYADSHKFNAATYVAVGPDGLDPCDLRSQRGDEAVQAMIAARRPLFEFAIKQKLAKFNLNSLEGQVAAARAAAPVIAGISDLATRSSYVRELAGWTNLDANEVSNFVKTAASASAREGVAKLRLDDAPAFNIDSAAPPAEPDSDQQHFASVNLSDPINRMERTTLVVMVQLPNAMPQPVFERIAVAGFSAPAHAELGRAIAGALVADPDLLSKGQNAYLLAVAALLPDQLQALLSEVAVTPLPVSDEAGVAAYAEGVMTRALDVVLNREKNNLLAALRRLDPANDSAAYREVSGQLMQIEAQRRSLR
jgi:DNA primase